MNAEEKQGPLNEGQRAASNPQPPSTATLKTAKGRGEFVEWISEDEHTMKAGHALLRKLMFEKKKEIPIEEVYYQTWNKSQGTSRLYFDEIVLPWLLKTATLVDSADLVRKVLSHFYKKKERCNEFSMLITQTHLKELRFHCGCPNDRVRRRAVGLFCEAFPFVDYTLTKRAKDEICKDQFQEMCNFASDEAPAVRSASILGVCRALAKRYHQLTPELCVPALQRVFEVHIQDEPEVRLSVIKGAVALVDGPASEVLRGNIKLLSPLLDDREPAIRMAFAQLLRKAHKAAHVWGFFFGENEGRIDIFRRIASDACPAVVAELVQLIDCWVLPRHATPSELAERAQWLLLASPNAAIQFYHRSYKLLVDDKTVEDPLPIGMGLVLGLLDGLEEAPVSPKKKGRKRKRGEEEEKRPSRVHQWMLVCVVLYAFRLRLGRSGAEEERAMLCSRLSQFGLETPGAGVDGEEAAYPLNWLRRALFNDMKIESVAQPRTATRRKQGKEANDRLNAPMKPQEPPKADAPAADGANAPDARRAPSPDVPDPLMEIDRTQA